MFIKRKKVEEVEAQITAMIDMTFLLLIFFMATAKFVLPEGTIPAFGIEKAEGIGGGVSAAVEPYEIHIIKSEGATQIKGKYRGVETEATGINQLEPIRARLTAYLNENLNESGAPLEGVEVTIQCGDDVKWEAMVRILDIIRETKIPKIRFIEQS
jgi:biopolymer transport protein ExbD